GNVVAEGWWTPYAPDRPHMLFSLSKSFTSTGVGFAVAEGRLSLDDSVLSFFPNDAPDEISDNLAAMKVRHLLTMSTGHDEDTTEFLFGGDDDNWPRVFLSRPVPYAPGTHFLYNTGATYMLSAIVQKLTGETLLDYLRPRLFEPLGIEGATWQTGPHGVNLGGTGLNVKTEDIARLGQLYLQKGVWQGRRLLPEAWVEAATTAQIDNGDDPDSDWTQGYGFQFWRCRHNAYRGDGAFGQYCIVMPDQDAVIAITSGVANMQAVLNLVWDHLLVAMGPERLPEDRDAHAALQAKLESLVLPLQAGATTSVTARKGSGATYDFDENDLGVDALRCDFGEETDTLVFGIDGVDHPIVMGHGTWVEGVSRLIGRGPHVWPRDEVYKFAASGGWVDDATYALKTYLYETPFCRTATLTFTDDTVKVEMAFNVGFGPTEGPTLTGSRRSG
ncbi:MAG: serine hydrolase domain-containing protein, partial [Anaerolineae bacterium]